MSEPPAGLTSLEALGLAIRAETDSRDLYMELARRCERPLVRRRFEQMAAEEEQHRAYLLERWEQIAGGVELKLPPTKLAEDMRTSAARQAHTAEEVLDSAIGEKRYTRDLYIEAARDTDDLSGRRMFQYLADMAHRQLALLAEERDLIHRYPRYYGVSPKPWQPERRTKRE